MARDTLVGFIFLAALALLVVAAMTVQGVSLTKNYYEHRVLFNQVSGLNKGDPVRVRGLTVGMVDDLDIDEPTGYVMVTLQLEKDIPPREDSKFNVMPASALGGNFIDYIPGEGPRLSPTDRPLGTATPDLLANLGEWFDRNSKNIEGIVNNIHAVTERLTTATGMLGRIISSEELAAQFDQIVANLESISAKADRGENLLGDLLNNREYPRQFERFLSNAEEIARKANEGDGLMATILNDQELRASVRTIVTDLQQTTDDLREKRGVAGKLISDEGLAQKFEAFVDDAVDVAHRITEGPGTAHEIVYDEQFANKVSSSIDNILDATRALGPEGEGTISVLLHDRDLANDIQGTISLLRESIEDTREQAPLTTFLNALFSAF